MNCESLEDRTTPTASAITSSFNGTGIAAGDYVWFSSVAKVSGEVSAPVTLNVTDQSIDFTSNGTSYSISVPDSTITLNPSSTTASTSYGANGWSVSAPNSYSGNVFLSGLGWQAPSNIGGSTVDTLLGGGGLGSTLNNLLGGLGGGLTSGLTSGSVKSITWNADFTTNTPGINVTWEWQAAVYTNFTGNEAGVQVKTVGSSQVDTFQNSDPAGTPENFKSYVTGGALGNGGTNWTGTATSPASVQPQVIAPAAIISGQVDYTAFGGPETPASGDTVTLTDANGNVVATTMTDTNGNYSFGNLSAGTYTVTESYGGTSQTVTIGNSGTTTVDLEYFGPSQISS